MAEQECRDTLDAVMARYDPDRARSQAHVLDLVQRRVETPGVVVDIGCGTGTLLATARKRWHSARLLGVDCDPVLLELARGRAESLEIHDLDVLQPCWTSGLSPGRVDAVVSTTALHDVPEAAVPALARDLATLLRPGGVLVDWDAFFSRDASRSASAAPPCDGPTWESWWEDLRRTACDAPQLSASLRERDERRRARPPPAAARPPSLQAWTSALSVAGFCDVEIGRRRADHCLLVATRGRAARSRTDGTSG